MTQQSFGSGPAYRPAYMQGRQQWSRGRVAVGSLMSDELWLKLLMITLFLPEGLSFFVADFRLSPPRVLLFVLIITVILRRFRSLTTPGSVLVPSDIIVLVAGAWMMLAASATDGFGGLKGAASEAIEFAGAYFAFRCLLGPVDSSVRVIRFSCKLLIPVVGIALLDPLTGKLFTYEVVKGITGYVKFAYEYSIAVQATSLFRNGYVRAMGPLEHSILFGAVCVWFGTLALCTFPSRLFGWSIAGIAFVGALFSQSQGGLVSYVVATSLTIFYAATPRFTWRWKVIGSIVALGVIAVILYSGSPVATFMRLGGISPETGWYRQAIWNAAVPLVAQSPFFGIGLTDDWGWQTHTALVSASVDAFWLKTAMAYGIPGSVLVFLTLVGAFWLGPVDRSRYLSREEKRLSVALGIVVATAIFYGFTVHLWGTCWVLLGAISGMRASLAEAAILRRRAARDVEARGG